MSETNVLPEVTVFAGPMASGKTTELLKVMGKFKAHNLGFEAYKPVLDIRDKVVKSRISSGEATTPCTPLESLWQIDAEELVMNGIKAIFLEEVHMFGYGMDHEPIDDPFMPVIEKWGKAGVTSVFAAGLDISAHGNYFTWIQDAHRSGANIQLLSATCIYPTLSADEVDRQTCGKIAHNTQIYEISTGIPYRRDTLPDLLPQEPEGTESTRDYRAVCMGHYSLSDELTVKFPETV